MARIKKNKILNLMVSATIAIVASVYLASFAFATVALIKPNDSSSTVNFSDYQSEKSVMGKLSEKTKGRAPEPSTLVLFGSSLIGMIISFVRKTYHIAKRILDVVASVIGLILLSPLFLLVAILVKLTSKGPIFYRQTRVGKDGELFDIYKFRTMRTDAEKYSGPVWASKNDNRITPIGNILRKTHVDEIPQFVNVLRGEMSVIGPRPERPVFVEQFKEEIPDYEKRLLVKPGITGLAQVWHRYDESIEDVKKKLKYDLLYIRRMCLWADFNIVVRTFRVVLTGEGAR